jgi:hypothetical protein
MNIGTYLYLIILFVIFSPGIVFSIPSSSSSSSSSSKMVRVFTHGFLFSVAWLFTHRTVNNIYSSIREGANGDTVVLSNISQTAYVAPPPAPKPPLPYIDTVVIVGKQDYLSLSEVQVWNESGQNVALGKKATQSSTGWGGSASLAVDGNTSGNYWSRSTTHTDQRDTNQWWKVELGSNHYIKEIIIFNRTDCCEGRLSNASLQLINGSQIVGTRTLTSEYKQSFKF